MKKIFICFFLLLSTALFAQDKSNLVFVESIYSVEIQIENGKNFLELDKENKIQIVTKNIDPSNFACSGRDLRRGDFSNRINITSWIATANNEDLKNGKYSLTIRFKGKRGNYFNISF
jgi:hypothetical protein